MPSELELCEQTYVQLVKQYFPFPFPPEDATLTFTSLSKCWNGCRAIQWDSTIPTLQEQEKYNEPMPWIGIYIAVASLVCTLAMAADLIHGLQHRKFWFPCKYFTLNAASLTVMAVAMKLPVDLSNPMPGTVDNAAKFASLLFMCTMMANFMPSLAAMANQDLFMNIIALDILVITVLVNVCIQAKTGVIGSLYLLTIMSTSLIFLVLMASTSLALAIPTSKSILELKYQAMHRTISDDQELQQTKFPTFNKLKQRVSKYWVMAGTGSPQFVVACSPACSASGVSCCVCAAFLLLQIVSVLGWKLERHDYHSDYKWTTLLILVTQSIGVVVGTISLLCRCFSALNFRLSLKWSKKHIQFFKIESYWSHKLVDWKRSQLPLSIGDHRCRILVHYVKNLILLLCIGLQKVIVVTCKIVSLIPVLFVILFFHCFSCCKSLLRLFLGKISGLQSAQTGSDLEHRNPNQDLSHYVLQLEDEVELSKRTLNRISRSVECLIKKSEKHQPNNLIRLLQKSTDLTGVGKFDDDHVPALLSDEHPNSWSLPVVTLTSMAIAIPNIQNGVVDSLLRSVSEGLQYVSLVEETLSADNRLVDIQRVAKKLWLEVEFYHRWLDNSLQKVAHEGKTLGMILQWLSNKAESIIMELKKRKNGGPETNELSRDRLIAANSMYRVTQSVLLYYDGKLEQMTGEQLFSRLSSMIADILGACLTNLPRVISMKCYTSAIEKREESVKRAAELLGQTKEMMNILEKYELPSLDPEKMAFIDEWRAFLKHPIA